MLCDSTDVAAVVRTRPRAIPLAMITIRKSTHGFPFISHIWVAYGAPLGGSSCRRSSATIHLTLKMTSAQVVETSVTNNSSFQNYPHPDDHTIRSVNHVLHPVLK